MMSEPEQKIPIVLEMLFPKDWLDSKREDDVEGRTNREVEAEVNGRFNVIDPHSANIPQHQAYRKRVQYTRPQTFIGTVSQMAAALTHHVSPERLQHISSSIPKVLILTGDTDNLIDPSNSHLLKKHMPEAELIVREGAGHGVSMQYKSWFNELLERVFKEGREKVQKQ